MALQTSGPISLIDIFNELSIGGLYEGNGQVGLGPMSVAAGKSAPHEMAEFYGYSAGGGIKGK